MAEPEAAKDRVLDSLILGYYKNYYQIELGLPDWEQRALKRLDEEKLFAEPVLRSLENFFNVDFKGKRILVVGAGTGAELYALASRGAEAYGIEPSPQAVEILKLKAEDRGFDPSRIVQGIAESLPFENGFFDFVYCYTVLEHVQDVHKTLKEMVRICSQGGGLFLETPNYRMPYEPHYKIFMPTFLPRFLLKNYLRVRRRPVAFLDSINFIRPKQVMDSLRQQQMNCLRIYHRYRKDFARKTNYIYLLTRYFGIERDLWILALKPAETQNESGD